MKLTDEGLDDRPTKTANCSESDLSGLLNCPCGAKSNDVDWIGSNSYGGKTYQTCWVTCSNCDTDVSITVNTDIKNDSKLYEEMVCEVWNKLTRAV